MNKTKMKINRKKSRTKKFKGGGFFGSIQSIFSFTEVSPNFKELLKNKNISDDVQNLYDAKDKDESKFNTALSGLKGKLTNLTQLIPKIEIEYNNKITKKPLLTNSNAKPTNARPNPANGRVNPSNARVNPTNQVSSKGVQGPLPQGQQR